MKLTEKQQLVELKRSDMTTMDEFLQTGESKVMSRHGDPIVYDNDNAIFWIKDRIAYCVACWYYSSSSRKYLHEIDSLNTFDPKVKEGFAGVVVPCSDKGITYKIILSGDEENEDELAVLENEELSATLSYECMAQLLSAPGKVAVSSDKAVSRIASLELKVVDSTADTTQPMTAANKRQIDQLSKGKKRTLNEIQEKIKPPEAGMTLVGSTKASSKWHRSATVLLSDEKKTYLIGQDEGTYFGCELADNPKNIAAAYTSLMPKQVRGKTGVLRQGEWFMVQVPANKVPAADKCICVGEEEDCITLPKDHPDSNSHYLSDGAFRVSAEGIFANGCSLGHEDHSTVQLPKKNWYTFFRNTAVRSVSQEGVD